MPVSERKSQGTLFVLAVFLILFAFHGMLHAELQTIDLSELKPGMMGYGLTVFSGLKPERFEVRFISVIDGPQPGKKSFLIEVKDKQWLSGRQIFGMGFSGSPIYFKQRLAGAIAYVDRFQTAVILGVTPISEMMSEMDKARRSGALDSEGETFARLPSLENREGVLAPEPGGMISIPLVRGDLWLHASGTITAVDGKVMLAFGHENGSWGDSIIFPLHVAQVNGIIPKLDISHKIATALDEVGAVVWDGKGGIVGQLGRKAPMVPVRVSYKHSKAEETKEYHLEMVGHTAVLPLAVGWSVFSIMDLLTQQRPDELAAAIRFRIRMKEEDSPATFTMRIVSNKDKLGEEVGRVRLILDSLFEDRVDKTVPESVEIEVAELPDGRSAGLKEAYFQKEEARPGETVTLYVVLEHSLEERKVIPVSIDIPEDFPTGFFPVQVVSGEKVRPVEQPPRNSREMKAWLEGVLRSDDLVVLYPGRGCEGAFYSGAQVARLVTRVPWALRGTVEAGINVRGSR